LRDGEARYFLPRRFPLAELEEEVVVMVRLNTRREHDVRPAMPVRSKHEMRVGLLVGERIGGLTLLTPHVVVYGQDAARLAYGNIPCLDQIDIIADTPVGDRAVQIRRVVEQNRVSALVGEGDVVYVAAPEELELS
jgi:hypothetical protein